MKDTKTELAEYQPKFTTADARKAGRFLYVLGGIVFILCVLGVIFGATG